MEKEGHGLPPAVFLHHRSQGHGSDRPEAAQIASRFQILIPMIKALILLFGLALDAPAGLSRLEAISMIETGDNDSARGGAGEVSRYQLMPRVWRHYTNSDAYGNPQISAGVAQQHLDYLEGWFRGQAGRPPSELEIYVLWNAGPTYYARKHFSVAAVHPSIRERAERFVNLREMATEAPTRPSLLAKNSSPK